MKKYLAIFTLIFNSGLASADCGKDLEIALKSYLEAINNSNYQYLSECASAEALNSYVQQVQHFVEKFPPLAQANPAWSESLSMLKAGKINHQELFIRIKTAQKEKRTADHTDIKSLEFIGSFKEGNYTHVLYRVVNTTDPFPSEQPEVFSFVQDGEQWKYAYFTYL